MGSHPRRHDPKALFGEVRIQCEGVSKSKPPHCLEARAIHKAQLPPSGNEKGVLSGQMSAGVYPGDLQYREYVRDEGPGRLDADATL